MNKNQLSEIKELLIELVARARLDNQSKMAANARNSEGDFENNFEHNLKLYNQTLESMKNTVRLE